MPKQKVATASHGPQLLSFMGAFSRCFAMGDVFS